MKETEVMVSVGGAVMNSVTSPVSADHRYTVLPSTTATVFPALQSSRFR